MEAEEHFYTDDPSIGPPDGCTTLKDVNYFFIGNGWITAAVQVCSSGEGTFLGLLLMHPEIFGPKRSALTFDSQTGLSQTSLKIILQDWDMTQDPRQVEAWWENRDAMPVVHAEWRSPPFKIRERFYCPDISTPRIIREIAVTSHWEEPVSLLIRTGIPAQTIEKELTLTPHAREVCFLEYRLVGEQPEIVVELSWVSKPATDADARNYWRNATSCQFDSPILNHMFEVSKNQLPANIAHSGRLDASMWQYNLEWVRDQSMIAIGLILSGYFEPAGTILSRLLTKFVTDKGDTLDSSHERPTSEVELDQNGELLLALRTYVDWTGDLDIVKRHWEKVRVTAEFPLQSVFRHPDTALLHNRREYWERHALHGIEDGMELAYQLFVSIGLSSAAYLADLLGNETDAERWRSAAAEIKDAMLSDPDYALVHEGHFIKRRHISGEIQREVHLKNETHLPEDTPLLQPGKHYLNPDSSAALPIAFELIDPASELAQKTLEHIEGLWNQKWQGGGYGRYNVTSEPDSPGPWPFPSLFVARAYLEMGQDEKVWRILKWLDSVPGSKSGAWFEFYGPRPVPPYPQVGIIPWTWAEQLILFVHHMLGIRPAGDKLLIRPRLLTGVEQGEASVRLRGIRVNLSVNKARHGARPGFRIEGAWVPYDKNGLLIDMPERDVDVEVWFP